MFPPGTMDSWNKPTHIFSVSLRQKCMPLLRTQALTGYSRGDLQAASIQGPRHLGAESQDNTKTQVG